MVQNWLVQETRNKENEIWTDGVEEVKGKRVKAAVLIEKKRHLQRYRGF